MPITVTAIPVLSDNYAWLLRDSATGVTAVVDPPVVGPVVAAIEAAGGRLDLILLTHHHPDHVDGTEALREKYNVPVIGARADAYRLPKLTREVAEGDTVALGQSLGEVIETPGHTVGHIAYYFADGPVLLSGDTLFSLGVGRFFEGTPAQMFASLAKFARLPDATLVCCGHEYTASNARFALSIDPDNEALWARAAEVTTRRAENLATVPSTLGVERATNPFLRATSAAALGEIRAAKDRF